MAACVRKAAEPLKAPFPWFGGKSRVADQVWQRFGDVPNYVEPFFGSGAVLLARPTPPGTETINDKDGFVANFWRAVQHEPDAVAKWADSPVNECDLLAREGWLIQQHEFKERMWNDPAFYDVKIAGWWVWGVCASIGNSWCAKDAPQRALHLGDPGMGVNRKLPHLGDPGMGVNRTAYIQEQMRALANRLRDVRVACGDWARIVTPTITERFGTTGVFFDPPYADDCAEVYGESDMAVASAVATWAQEHGDNPAYRIALCGYEGEHTMPDDWECVAWKAAGGYGSQGSGRGRANCRRERIWFSPRCLGARQMELT